MDQAGFALRMELLDGLYDGLLASDNGDAFASVSVFTGLNNKKSIVSTYRILHTIRMILNCIITLTTKNHVPLPTAQIFILFPPAT